VTCLQYRAVLLNMRTRADGTAHTVSYVKRGCRVRGSQNARSTYASSDEGTHTLLSRNVGLSVGAELEAKDRRRKCLGNGQ
jgi:hypothetical protein